MKHILALLILASVISAQILLPILTGPIPASGGAGMPLVLSYTPGSDRNDFTAWLGFSFTATAFTVHSIGLRCATGNSGNHDVYLFTGGSQVIHGVVNPTGCTIGTFYYDSTITPTLLTNGMTYQLYAAETIGGQNWADLGALTLTALGSVPMSIFSVDNGSSFVSVTTDTAYVGVDLKN